MLCNVCGTEYYADKCPLCQTPANGIKTARPNISPMVDLSEEASPISPNLNSSAFDAQGEVQPVSPQSQTIPQTENNFYTIPAPSMNPTPNPTPSFAARTPDLQVPKHPYGVQPTWAQDNYNNAYRANSFHETSVKKSPSALQVVIFVTLMIMLAIQIVTLSTLSSLNNNFALIASMFDPSGSNSGDNGNDGFFQDYDNYDDFEDFFNDYYSDPYDEEDDTTAPPQEDAENVEPLYPNGVSNSEMAQISEGMSYAEISAIIGGDGDITEGVVAGDFTASWIGENTYDFVLTIEFIGSVAVDIQYLSE